MIFSVSKDKDVREEVQDLVELPVLSMLKSSVAVGASAGGAGLLVGSVMGILCSNHPVIFATLSGVQCFGLGTTYWTTRQCLMHEWQQDSTRRNLASTISGAVAGASMGGLIRGRSNVIPGAIFWGLSGLAGQYGFDALDGQQSTPVPEPLGRSIWDSKWLPMKRLSDDEYEKMLKERLLKVDADISLVDEDLAGLKADQAVIRK